MSDLKFYVYDIETFPSCFSVVIGDFWNRRCWTYEISWRKDDRKKLFSRIKKIRAEKDAWMVGYNSYFFDYPVLHYILRNPDCSPEQIYAKAMDIINTGRDEKFKHVIFDNQMIVPQLDLFLIHHFDNVSRSTSLKMLEFNMRSDNIEDLPFDVGKHLTSEEIDVLIKYNKHDMSETSKFLEKSLSQIEFRKKLSDQYDRNFMNHNDTKIGKDYFIMKLEEEMPGSCYKKVDGRRKPRQTARKVIDLSECIFDYIKFDRPEFQAVLDWLKKQKIRETKGVFTDILESDLGELAQYCTLRTKRKKFFKKPSEKQMEKYKQEKPLCWLQEEQLKSGKVSYWLCWNVADNLNCVIDGFQYDFGTGGIHGSIESQTVVSDDQKVIIDQDVASYYPNMAISNRIYPEHLGEQFCDIYKDVYEQRKSYAKGTVENAMMKLALNGVYGDSNNKFSPFYDPKYTMSITIGGQLSLCMLAEKLIEVPTLRMVQVNTDGLTYQVNRKFIDQAQEICNEWEKIAKLELEGAEYSRMFIRDVNNYIAEYSDGKLKNKGAYQWDGLGWHQNHSAPVIGMAAENALVRGVDVEQFIRNHENHMDFMLRTKVPRSSRLVLSESRGVVDPDSEIQVQNICRYYISNEGHYLTKIMPPLPKGKKAKLWKHELTGETLTTTKSTEETKAKRNGYVFVEDTELPPEERRIGIDTDWKVKVCNDISKYDGDINYEYYIREAKKLVDPLLTTKAI